MAIVAAFDGLNNDVLRGREFADFRRSHEKALLCTKEEKKPKNRENDSQNSLSMYTTFSS